MPKFSIIIPVYNVAPYLRECLDSVLAQTYTDWEAICVDDGSTDGSGAILDEYAAEDGRFRVIHQKNAGVSAARNAALDVMSGEWVCFLDADDVWHREFLADVIRAVSRHPDCRLFRHGLVRYRDGVVCDMGGNAAVFQEKDVSKEILACDFYGHYFWEHVYHRDVIGALRFPYYHRGEDRVFLDSILLKRCDRIAFSETPRYGYRIRPGSAMNSVPSVRVLFDEMDHRCDIIEMCDASNKVVKYDKGECRLWLEHCFTNGIVRILLGRNNDEQRVLWTAWQDRLKRVRRAKRISLHGRIMLFVYGHCGQRIKVIWAINLIDRICLKLNPMTLVPRSIAKMKRLKSKFGK